MRPCGRAALVVALAGAAILAIAAPASAHVVPSTEIVLDVHSSDITAALTMPVSDLVTASGIDVPTDGSAITADAARQVSAYLEKHFVVESASGDWSVTVGDIALTTTQQWGTGEFTALTAAATLVPPTTAELRSFTLDYDAIIHQVITADIYVVLGSDWAAGDFGSARALGTITVNTVTGEIPTLQVDLDSGSAWRGFVGMVTLGISHIAEGTDHQLFLLTLLLPAPLIAVGRRWSAVATTGRSVRRIAAITIAFTLGHSTTLALGALGLPVPQQPIEAAIALSILIAALHAIHPLFPGREAFIAAGFGLVHGMAFSETLTEMRLSGSQLALSLLGFNLGIEIMQLVVVALVLPPLMVLARTRLYRPLRLGAAGVTGIAAIGWVFTRVGVPNAVGTAADLIGTVSPFIAGALWLAAVIVLIRERRLRHSPEVPAAEVPDAEMTDAEVPAAEAAATPGARP
ncbi:MAG: HupE/UreJ family protein [Microbacteriaceae bacterium]